MPSIPPAPLDQAQLAHHKAPARFGILWIAPFILPHLRGRPVTMERYHRGIAADGFFQKDVSKGFPEWLERIEEETGERQHIAHQRGGEEPAHGLPAPRRLETVGEQHDARSVDARDGDGDGGVAERDWRAAPGQRSAAPARHQLSGPDAAR